MNTNLAALALVICQLISAAAVSEEPPALWRIGTRDANNREFAFAPSSYTAFKDDAFFVIGESDPGHDWPYAQPGPVDGWGGNRPHTFTTMVSSGPTT